MNRIYICACLSRKTEGRALRRLGNLKHKVLIPLPEMPETDERNEFVFLPVLPRVSF